jgi:hypothetical protein
MVEWYIDTLHMITFEVMWTLALLFSFFNFLELRRLYEMQKEKAV